MFSHDLEQSLNQAFYFARESNHELITIEHLLLSVLDRSEVVDLLRRCGANGASRPTPTGCCRAIPRSAPKVRPGFAGVGI